MKKIVFDTSIHLGQFSTTNEVMRVACKNSQAKISTKPHGEIVGVITFNENSWSDHIIWSLERIEQDTFYKFMDVFHSVKNIDRVPLSSEASELALELKNKLDLEMSNALTCATAILTNAQEIHTFYKNLLRNDVVDYMKKTHEIVVFRPPAGAEIAFLEPGLENSYQETLQLYRERRLHLPDRFHK